MTTSPTSTFPSLLNSSYGLLWLTPPRDTPNEGLGAVSSQKGLSGFRSFEHLWPRQSYPHHQRHPRTCPLSENSGASLSSLLPSTPATPPAP